MHSTTWSKELGACARLAAPIALTQVAQMCMQLVDTFVVTPLGPEPLGAVGLGHNAFFAVVWPLIGVLFALDTETSQAVGRQDERAAARSFAQAMLLLAGLVLTASLGVALVAANMESFGVNPAVAPLSSRYLTVMIAGILPLGFSFASTKFLQAHEKTSAVLAITIGANVLNFFLATGLVHGKWGLPPMGIVGAGISTCICRWAIALAHLFVLWRMRFPFARADFMPDRAALAGMLRLGVPAGLQLGLEIGIFALSSFMVARFEPSTLAAHHLLLQVATFTFMFPVGIAGAAAVRVGHAIGAGQQADAGYRGTVAIAFGGLVMAVSGLILVAVGGAVTRLVDAAPAVTAAFISLVGFAAAFQVFDGIQVTATGALRGLGDTRRPFIANLVGHWLVAFPLTLVVGFQLGYGARGIWLALTCGLIVVALALLWVWRAHTVRLGAWTRRSSSGETSSSPSSTVTS